MIDEIDEISSTPAPTISPSAFLIASPMPEITETPFAVNPLYSFYHEYKTGCCASGEMLIRALSDANTADSLRLSMALSEHLIALSDISATICRLFSSDDGYGYSGTVEGAACGSGTMNIAENGVYDFSFAYTNGTALLGSYSDYMNIHFSLGQYETPISSDQQSSSLDLTATPPPYREPVFFAEKTCTIQKTAEGWTSTVEADGMVSSFTVTDGVIEFTLNSLTVRLTGGEIEVTEASEAPIQ